MALTETREIKERAGYKQRLREVLKVSARIFAEDGYEKAGIRKITKELGKSLSAIYYYVNTKEELLYLIQLETFSSLVDELDKRIKTTSDPAEQIQLMIENHISHFVNHMDELKVCSHEMETLSGEAYREVLDVRRRYYSAARSIVANLLGQLGNDKLDADLATLNLFGMLNWIYMWYDPKRNKSVDELVDQINQLFLHGLVSVETKRGGTGAE